MELRANSEDLTHHGKTCSAPDRCCAKSLHAVDRARTLYILSRRGRSLAAVRDDRRNDGAREKWNLIRRRWARRSVLRRAVDLHTRSSVGSRGGVP